ncbi:TasA family protein [Microbacterium sp. M1A1_1b]
MTRTTTTHGRHRAARRHRWLLPSALVLVAGVLLSLLGTGGTYALWNAAASTRAATVKSGTATLTVGQLSAMNTTVIGPGSSTVGSFTVKNTGTVPLSLRVTTTATTVSSAGTTDAVVLGAQTLKTTGVASASACRAGLGGTSGPLASFDTGSGWSTLAAGASSTACVEVALAQNAPQSVAGAVTSFTLTVTGTQVAP